MARNNSVTGSPRQVSRSTRIQGDFTGYVSSVPIVPVKLMMHPPAPFRFHPGPALIQQHGVTQASELTLHLVILSILSDTSMPISTSPATGRTTTQKSANAIIHQASTIAFVFRTPTTTSLIRFSELDWAQHLLCRMRRRAREKQRSQSRIESL